MSRMALSPRLRYWRPFVDTAGFPQPHQKVLSVAGRTVALCSVEQAHHKIQRYFHAGANAVAFGRRFVNKITNARSGVYKIKLGGCGHSCPFLSFSFCSNCWLAAINCFNTRFVKRTVWIIFLPDAGTRPTALKSRYASAAALYKNSFYWCKMTHVKTPRSNII